MPPKAKAAMMRPAGRVQGILKRPSKQGGVAPAPKRAARLGDLGMAELSRLGHVWVKKGRYYHREVNLAGKVEGVRAQEGQVYLDLEATGTEDEGLLRSLSGRDGRRIAVHVCPSDCGQVLSDEFLVHGMEYEEVDIKQMPWFSNLRQVRGTEAHDVDELEKMRMEVERRGVEREGRPEGSPRPAEEKVKKKKEKKNKEERRAEDKRRQLSSPDEDGVVAGQKDLSALFEGTALDPKAKSRRQFLKKARRLGRGKKKKKKSSASSGKSSSSSKDSTSEELRTGGLFSSEKKMKLIWRQYPGALAASSLMDARELLVTTSGTLWDVDHAQLPPIATQFVRMHLASQMSPPMLQEALTLSTCIDGLLTGRVAATVDVLFQRLKALENVARGSHWSVGRQLELVRSDMAGLTNETEGLDAARRAKEEEKLRSVLTRPSGPRSGDYVSNQKGKKGKDSKGSGKGGGDDRKGKGNDQKKENKGSWQKSDK